MSRIDDLIRELCPKGVEFGSLGSLATVTTGSRPPDEVLLSAGTFPYVNGGVVPSGHVAEGNTPGETVTIPSRGSVGVVQYQARAFWCGPLCYRIRSAHDGLLTRFLFFALKAQERRIVALQQTGSIPALNKKQLIPVRIPVPPLEVQAEIVRVLDLFQSLEAELEAELEARRRQYAHYRDALLSFSEVERERVRWMTLADVCRNVTSGGTPSTGRSDFYGGSIPWVRTQEVDYAPIRTTGVSITEEGLRNSSAKWIPANCVIVAMYGATAAKVAVNEVPVTTNQACCNLEVASEVASVRYVFHWLSNEYGRLRSLGEGSQSNLNARKIKNYPIPVPSLEEQDRIVSILDSFDQLVNDLSIGLPAELVARRRQYEYYRDRLLTFEEAA